MLKRRGFSLVELLTVIAIIAILAAIIFPVMATVKAKARQQGCMSQLHDLALRADMYKKDNGKYPETLGPQWQDGVNVDKVVVGSSPQSLFIRGYIDDIKRFHCPSDTRNNLGASVNYMNDQKTGHMVTTYEYSSYDFYSGGTYDSSGTRYATRWADLSGGAFATLAVAAPYPSGDSSKDDLATQQQDYQRQLCWRNPPSDTVLTWCSYHADDPEGANPTGVTVYVFADGHTSTIPANLAKACRWRVRPK